LQKEFINYADSLERQSLHEQLNTTKQKLTKEIATLQDSEHQLKRECKETYILKET
jgi:cell division protein FtsB